MLFSLAGLKWMTCICIHNVCDLYGCDKYTIIMTDLYLMQRLKCILSQFNNIYTYVSFCLFHHIQKVTILKNGLKNLLFKSVHSPHNIYNCTIHHNLGFYAFSHLGTSSKHLFINITDRNILIFIYRHCENHSESTEEWVWGNLKWNVKRYKKKNLHSKNVDKARVPKFSLDVLTSESTGRYQNEDII